MMKRDLIFDVIKYAALKGYRDVTVDTVMCSVDGMNDDLDKLVIRLNRRNVYDD
jgi:hypothetical protein